MKVEKHPLNWHMNYGTACQQTPMNVLMNRRERLESKADGAQEREVCQHAGGPPNAAVEVRSSLCWLPTAWCRH